jgi:hypothetical protein
MATAGFLRSFEQCCPFSVRELLPKAAKTEQCRGSVFYCFVGLDWLVLLGVAGEFPLLTGGL